MCVCACLLAFTGLVDFAALTPGAASGLPWSSGGRAAGPLQPELEDELSVMMTARHMSIKER